MIALFNFHLLSSIWLLLLAMAIRTFGESSTCLTVYREGGAPAVFQSPKCPRWKLSSFESYYASQSWTTEPCQLAMLQGRRYSQEDRALCVLDLRIPFPGKVGLKEVNVGVVAVFDGHNGAEASEMASKLLLEYFILHTYFLLDATYSVVFKRSIGGLLKSNEDDTVFQLLNWDEVLGHHGLDLERFKTSLSENFVDAPHLVILKEALLRAINDIDAIFTKASSRKNLESGSTATVILLADGQLLVANIGDSKAFLCSEKFQSAAEAKATYLKLNRQERRNGAMSHVRNVLNSRSPSSSGSLHFSVKELTRDHHPNRDDERFRVENAGGYVLEWGGVPRVNGQLAISRAIGDVSFKSYGVISAPELTDWQPLTANDSYLVAASDGLFEKLSLQDVCDLIWEVRNHDHRRSELSTSCSYSLADCIVNNAFEKGSMDNVATVVVPLERLNKGDKVSPASGLQRSTYDFSVNEIGSEIVHVKPAHPVMTMFERLLVERKQGYIGSFYLAENLAELTDYTLQAEKFNHGNYAKPKALPGSLDHSFSGSVNLYHDHNLCLHYGVNADGAKDQCINPEGFSSFIGFLESIPIHGSDSKNGSSEFEIPSLSYVLKKRFGQGSYGEVWMAFHWNFHEGSNSSDFNGRENNVSFNSIPFDSKTKNSSSSGHNGQSGSLEDNLFVLKRIMVEKGTAVYLSGLRERHFGEVFLNASKCLGGLPPARALGSFPKTSCLGFYDIIETNEYMAHEIGNSWSFKNIIQDKFSPQMGFYEEGLHHIARFVESFESRSNEIWLVFHYEGVSLSKLLYSLKEADKNGNEERADNEKYAQMLYPSKWWHWLKTTKAGHKETQSLIWQLLMAVKSCHDRNITHRDIKPGNMVICFEDQKTGRCLNEIPKGEDNFTSKMRIIDFGSAMDEFTLKHLYGSLGPSKAEQTNEYAPPEALLNSSWHQGPMTKTLKYDMWSIGVVILELTLGSPNVFQISAYTRALLDQHLLGWNVDLKELAYKLRSFMELCILVPGDFSKLHRTMDRVGVSPASWKCSEEFFSYQIRSRDPLKIGFNNVWLLRLVRDLLLWDPEDRLTVDEALQHQYFKTPPKE
ncbi:uncharacterized protein LOC133791475 [Humulus lupulus]|uniref:uncharacterized protein LOC133791475 n=1 Tax=Humulus lupulus TaxID=3486 RepID=UPI002B4053F1|nr:uncharacterized protein LOC133791475 [Humulus lupulus]